MYSPMNIMLVSLRYALHTFSVSRTSKSGNKITGMNDVTARGTASVIQYTDINRTTNPHFDSQKEIRFCNGTIISDMICPEMKPWNRSLQLSDKYQNFTVYYTHSQIHKYHGFFQSHIYLCIMFVTHQRKLINSTFTLQNKIFISKQHYLQRVFLTVYVQLQFVSTTNNRMPNIKLSQIPEHCGCSKLSKILSHNCLLNIFTILSITVFSATSKILEHCGLFNSVANI